MAPATLNDRQRRIVQLSQLWGIVLPPAPAPLARPPLLPASFRTPADDQTAEELMQRRAADVAQCRPKSGLRQAFSSTNLKKGKNWNPREVLEVLAAWVANAGSPGVAEALIAKLAAAGVDLGGTHKPKAGLLNRRRSIESFGDRSRLLRLAVDNAQLDMVQVLLPHADSLTIDTCLPAAIRSGHAPIVELLLQHGASAAQSPDGQDAFRQACVLPGQSHVVGLILRSDGRPPPPCTSAAMADAARAGCLETVLQLSRSTADGNHAHAEALKSAIGLGRRDIALAIVMGNRPPQRPGVDEAFQLLYDHASLNPSAKLELSELLLCAGAEGIVVARALERSCETQFLEMAHLLTAYGASVEYNDATVLKTAIARGNLDLVSSLLHPGAALSPSAASSCVPLIPKRAPFEYRYSVLSLLLHKGANGTVLDEMLIDAVAAGDTGSVDLLLTPFFPVASSSSPPSSASPGGASYAPKRHAVASVDFKSGEGLRTAVLRGDISMTQKILGGQPSPETLSGVFPLTKKLPSTDRYQMAELFLQKSLSGPSLHAALHDAIGEDVSQRDISLVKLLLKHGADVNFSQGPGLASLIKQKDVELLAALLQKASPQTAAFRVKDAMQVADHRARYEITAMLLQAGAAVGSKEIATALLETLSERPIDMPLLQLLLRQGSADINLLDGAIVKKAIVDSDPKVLELVLCQGKPSASSITCCLKELVPLPSTESKAWKLNTIMAKSNRKDDLSWLLVHEVQSVVKTEGSSLATLKQLLVSGADPNAYKAASLCHAVIAANSRVVGMLFDCSMAPKPAALSTALPHALRIPEPAERLAMTKQLVDAGASPLEVNRALVHAIVTYPKDIPLIHVLAAAADTSDDETLALSVSKESPDILNLLLAQSQYPVGVRSATLGKVMEIKNRAARMSMCQSLLKAGVSTEMASSALLVAARDGDPKLGDVLMAHGASIASNNGQAIVEACRGGSADVLSVLLKADAASTSKQTLEAGFQAATELSDLNKRAVIFEQLLKRGVRGESVDAQLESATRYGTDGHEILRVLLVSGADPNYNAGECVVLATRSAFVGSLELLLGLWKDGGNQKTVSQPTLVRALKASWVLERDNRFRIVSSLMKAGLQATDELHIALNDAVNEEDAEERLVRLLLNHGASPAANGCKTLVDAARTLASSLLALVLEKKMPENDVSRAFTQAFAAEAFSKWFTEAGLETAQLLLAKGARGDALSSALVLIMKNSTPETRDFADGFFDLLMAHGPDVDYNNGEPLQQAASKADVAWTAKLLECRPSAQTLSLAFQCIFDTALSQDGVLDLFKMFAEYHEGDVGIDVMIGQQGSEPVLVRAINQYPRSTKILTTLLDAGFYHDQATACRIHPEIEEEEEVTLLVWAISQPQKRVSTAVIELLIERGAKVNVETSLSRTTPLMLAVQNKRPDVVKLLLLQGACVDVVDYQGRTPLATATHIGGDVAVQMLSSLLAAEPSKDDGSLHNAARDLNLPVVKVLAQSGHDPDFPSPLHGGRSALAEVCLHGSDAGEMTTERERAMQKVMAFLIDCKSALSIKSGGKSLLHLCFDAADPVVTSRALLKGGMWKHVNKAFNNYVDEGYTYSATMYVSRVLPASDVNEELLSVLRASRATDVFYAHEGPQPEGATGLPEDMEVQERARKARLARMAEESEEFSIAMARKREMASVEQQILAHKAEMEEARRRKLHNDDVAALRARAQLDETLASAAHQRRLAEQRAVAEASVGRARALAATELEAEEARQRKALEWEARLNAERVDNARALSSIRLGERQELERIDKGAEQRTQARLEAQRKLVDSQDRLARRLADGPSGMGDARRQIGYVTELN